MEHLFRIVSCSPLQAREYTDRNGETKVFNTRSFVLSDGINSIYAEAQGDYAVTISAVQFDNQSIYNVEFTVVARPWESNGTTRYSNDIVIKRIGKLC